MNILVTGCHGQLGTHLQLAAKSSKHTFHFTDIESLDITNAEAVSDYFKQKNINLVVNCAAYTNVDRAEDDEANADRVNHLAVKILADVCRSFDSTLIHISTDYVFGGNLNNTPCTEEQTPNPTGAYGRTKLSGEDAILASCCRYIILRTSWLYSEYGKNFVKTMLNAIATKPTCKVVYDQVGTPTYAGDLAKAILHIIESGLYADCQGIYHYSNEGVCSWYDFTQEIARQVGNQACDIQPCRSSEYPSRVVRPAYSVLDKSKFKRTFGIAIPYWTASLTRCIRNLAQQA